MTQITSASTIGRMTNAQGLPPVADQVNPVANRFDHPRVGENEKVATGIPAVLHAMQYALPNNGGPSLLTINKHKTLILTYLL